MMITVIWIVICVVCFFLGYSAGSHNVETYDEWEYNDLGLTDYDEDISHIKRNKNE